jgi:DNA replication protein DnaC
MREVDSYSHEKRERPSCSVCALVAQRRDCSPPTDLVPDRYAAALLDTLPKALVDSYRKCRGDQGVMLWGPAGTGKTHAMCAFARDLWKSGRDPVRVPYDLLMLMIRDTYKQSCDTTELEIVQEMATEDVLFLEDVGTTVSVGARESDFSLRTFLLILDQRLEHCRPTFVTSNKSIEEIRESFDARIASRLQQACIVMKLVGKDRRAEGQTT